VAKKAIKPVIDTKRANTCMRFCEGVSSERLDQIVLGGYCLTDILADHEEYLALGDCERRRIIAEITANRSLEGLGKDRDIVSRLYGIASSRELETLDELMVRSGILWSCEICNSWLNAEDNTTCGGCGGDKELPF